MNNILDLKDFNEMFDQRFITDNETKFNKLIKYHGLLNKDRVYIKKENKNSKAYLKKQNNDMFNYFNNPKQIICDKTIKM